MKKKIIGKVAIAAVGATVVLGVTTPLGAEAASLITGAQIKDGTITHTDISSGLWSYSQHGESGYKQLADNQVTGEDIKDGSLGAGDLSSAAHDALKGDKGDPGAPGEKGDPGAPGDKGDKGDNGKDGVAGLHADAPYGANLPGQDSSATTVEADATTVVWTACAPGEVATGGGYRFGNAGTSESFSDSQAEASGTELRVVANEPAYYKDGKLVNGSEAAPVNDNLSFAPNAWAVTVQNTSEKTQGVRAWVICAKVPAAPAAQQ